MAYLDKYNKYNNKILSKMNNFVPNLDTEPDIKSNYVNIMAFLVQLKDDIKTYFQNIYDKSLNHDDIHILTASLVNDEWRKNIDKIIDNVIKEYNNFFESNNLILSKLVWTISPTINLSPIPSVTLTISQVDQLTYDDILQIKINNNIQQLIIKCLEYAVSKRKKLIVQSISITLGLNPSITFGCLYMNKNMNINV